MKLKVTFKGTKTANNYTFDGELKNWGPKFKKMWQKAGHKVVEVKR